MTKVFISYSRKDLKFVKELASDLKDAGVSVWYDLSRLEGGDQWATKIQGAINSCDKFILVISPDSIKSTWVLKEFLYAGDVGKKIVPLLHKKCKLPLWLQDIQYIDIQENNYKRIFHEILHTLGEKGEAQEYDELEELESQAIKYELHGDLWNARKTWYEIKHLDPSFPRMDIKIQELENELAAERRQRTAKDWYKRSRIPASIFIVFLGLAFLLFYPKSPMTLISPTATTTPTFTATPTQTSTGTMTLTPTFTATPTQTPTTTMPPTSTPTPTPSITPTPGFELISIDEIVYRGGEASAEIRTQPDTYCTLTFFLPSGTMSSASGTGACTADENGYCTWTWDIRSNVNPGYGNIVIIADEQQESYPIKIE